MQKCLLFLVCFHLIHVGLAQKPALDASTLGKWPSILEPRISNDGRYVCYTIEGSATEGRTFVVRNTFDNGKRAFVGASHGLFSNDSKMAIFQSNDSLYFWYLESNRFECIINVSSYKEVGSKVGEWVAYQLIGQLNEVVLLDMRTKKELRFPAVISYEFNKKGSELLLKCRSSLNNEVPLSLRLINLLSGELKEIWTESDFPGKDLDIYDYSFDNSGGQLVFIMKDGHDGFSEYSIWYYRLGMKKSVLRVNNRSDGIGVNYTLSWNIRFSENGRWIFFGLLPVKDTVRPIKGAVQVDVWSYKDADLQPEQMRLQSSNDKELAAVVSVDGGPVVRLEQANEELQTYPDQIRGDFAVVSGKYVDYWSKRFPQPSFYLMSLKDGSRRLLRKEYNSLNNFSFSPTGKYLVYFDTRKRAYFSFDIQTSKTKNITGSLPVSICNEYGGHYTPIAAVDPIAGWQEGDSSLLLYDNYDIWQIDVEGKWTAINVTKGYGVKNKVKLRLVYGPNSNFDHTSILFSNSDSLLLTGFNVVNKFNGFYRVYLAEKRPPRSLTMGPYTFYRVESQKPHFYAFDNGLPPIKAESTNAWIVKRQSATEFPNYFYTSDFVTFIPMSDLQPQKTYNWLTAELITWKQLDGTFSQGVLYKPENFNPHKKYPIIFNYYEQLSHRLYEFPVPAFTGGDINIPWFVSQGYLVFTPDIHSKDANLSNKTIGEWAYNSIVSAAYHLSKMPYVDGRRMGIQGHSFGGMETSYLVTHTHLFAAAAEAAGATDPISHYLTLLPFMSVEEHFSAQSAMEMGHDKYGANPWERPDLYRRNSAVLNADRVTTPLLIMHNKLDNQIQWRQGVELYMALRRLDKRVWMLQYDGGTHVLMGKNAVDYTTRLTQFFDYYLKSELPPKWMTEGIPDRLKGIETGYELDRSGKLP